jgi:RNA polymerase primary sigma factor
MRQLKITSKITNRESAALDKYLTEIGRVDLLTPEQETELAQRIKLGDSDALEKLTKANLRFVVSVAKQYQNNGLSLSDLINEGNIGLMKAAKRFDETKGFKFISYAVWWIRQSILQAIIEYSRMVRLPLSKVNAYNKVNKAFLSFIQSYEREPTLEEMAEILEMSPADISAVLSGQGKHLSMDAPLSQDSNSISMLDTLSIGQEESPDSAVMHESLKEEIVKGMQILTPRERTFVKAYYGIDSSKAFSFNEISENYGVSKERARQIVDRAMRRLRRNAARTNLLSYL